MGETLCSHFKCKTTTSEGDAISHLLLPKNFLMIDAIESQTKSLGFNHTVNTEANSITGAKIQWAFNPLLIHCSIDIETT